MLLICVLLADQKYIADWLLRRLYERAESIVSGNGKKDR